MHQVNAHCELPPRPKEMLMNVLFVLLDMEMLKEVLMNVLFALLDTQTVMDKTLL
jgi:hypothetical protein